MKWALLEIRSYNARIIITSSEPLRFNPHVLREDLRVKHFVEIEDYERSGCAYIAISPYPEVTNPKTGETVWSIFSYYCQQGWEPFGVLPDGYALRKNLSLTEHGYERSR